MSASDKNATAMGNLTADAHRGEGHLDLIIKRLQDDATYVERLKGRYGEELLKPQPNLNRMAELLEEVQHHFTSNVLPNLRLDNVGRAASSVRQLALLTDLTKD